MMRYGDRYNLFDKRVTKKNFVTKNQQRRAVSLIILCYRHNFSCEQFYIDKRVQFREAIIDHTCCIQRHAITTSKWK